MVEYIDLVEVYEGPPTANGQHLVQCWVDILFDQKISFPA